MQHDTFLDRRQFLAGSAALGLTAGRCLMAADFNEPSRKLPVTDCDVIVAGGGPAGIAAAVNAARRGARVRLFELQGALGGVWTSGLLGCMIDFDKSETDREITARLKALGAWRARRPLEPHRAASNYVYEPEMLKLVCEEMCTEAGVAFHLHTPVVAAYRAADGRNLETVVTESKSGRRAWRAKVFVDCTGDGDLSALAGCGFDVGGPDGTADQPASLCAVAVSPAREALLPFVVNSVPPDGDRNWSNRAKDRFLAELRRAGLPVSYSKPTLFEVRDGLYVVMMNHEYGVAVDDEAAITRATVRARSEILRGTMALASLGGAWKGFRVVATSEQLAHRAARRIHGRYTLTTEDVKNGSTFPDPVTTSNFSVDIHATTAQENATSGYSNRGVKSKPFQIPLRACQARDADNLYMAGRCISGGFIPMASYRVTGSAVAMGEAVGREAARRIMI